MPCHVLTPLYVPFSGTTFFIERQHTDCSIASLQAKWLVKEDIHQTFSELLLQMFVLFFSYLWHKICYESWRYQLDHTRTCYFASTSTNNFCITYLYAFIHVLHKMLIYISFLSVLFTTWGNNRGVCTVKMTTINDHEINFLNIPEIECNMVCPIDCTYAFIEFTEHNIVFLTFLLLFLRFIIPGCLACFHKTLATAISEFYHFFRSCINVAKNSTD